jgi:uncharacterized iron-regulated membrane protein
MGGDGATIGIAVGVSAAVLLLAAIVAWVLWRQKRRSARPTTPSVALKRTQEYGAMSAVQTQSDVYGSSVLTSLN